MSTLKHGMMEYTTGNLFCLVLCALIVPAEGAGGKSIFKLGDYVDHKPFEVMIMYFTVFAITILYEWIVAYVDRSVTTHSGKNIVHHVYSEVMILGGISALLTVFENLGGTAYFEAALFHFVHFVIFVMALFFIGLVGSLFIFIDYSWKVWSRFEFKVVEIENDPSLEPESKSAFLQQYLKSVKNGQKMLACIIFFRQNLPPNMRDISFARYMKKQQRKLLLSFLDLEWTTWAMLSLLCTMAAIVTYITLQISENDLATIGLWVLFVGFGPLLVLIVTFFKIKREFSTFTNSVQEMRQDHKTTSERKQKSHFWRGSPEFMTFMMQVMLVYQVFYLANCTVNFTYRLWQISGGFFLIVVCFVPSLFVFFLMIPLSMPPFTILASMGDFLSYETLERIKKSDEMGGKYRRRALRGRTVSDAAQFLQEDDANILGITDDVDDEGHGHGHGHGHEEHDDRKLISDEGILPLNDPHHHGHGHGHGHDDPERPDVICEECNLSPAAETCGICGILCNNCTKDYHKLKKFSDHHVIKLKNSLFAPKLPLLTDNPIINKERTAASLYKKTGAVEEVIEATKAAHTNASAEAHH